MAFPIKDVRLTTRGRRSGAPTLHPRLLRDPAILPQIGLAIRYFESMLGRERREIDPEPLIHFFGDPKLARCLIACLARGYRYQTPELAEIVSRSALRRLDRLGLASPKALRLQLYDRVNEREDGFLGLGRRAAAFADLERELRLRAGELERLLTLDAAEHAILIRIGDEPRPADVIAQYNFGVLDTLLRQAESVELTFADRPDADAARTLCSANQVEADVMAGAGRPRLEIRGRQDALGAWTRQGRRLARTVAQILERARPAVLDGSAHLVLRDRRGSLRLTGELLDMLAGSPAPSTGWDADDGWDTASLAQVAAGRPAMQGGASARSSPRDRSATRPATFKRTGWSVRRLPDPQAWSAGVIVPDLLVDTGAERVFVCAVRSPAHATRLAPIAQSARTGEPFVFVGDPAALAPLQAAGARTLAPASPDGQALREARPAYPAEIDQASPGAS